MLALDSCQDYLWYHLQFFNTISSMKSSRLCWIFIARSRCRRCVFGVVIGSNRIGTKKTMAELQAEDAGVSFLVRRFQQKHAVSRYKCSVLLHCNLSINRERVATWQPNTPLLAFGCVVVDQSSFNKPVLGT